MILLLALPAGLLVGLIGGKAVDPDMLFRGERISTGPDATARADAQVARRNAELLETERPSSFRPELDYEEEVWPEDYAAPRAGDPGEYRYYSGEDFYSDNALFEDDYRPAPRPEPRLDAESRAQESASPTTSTAPSARYAPLGERNSAPAPSESGQPTQSRSSEPRTADGDLPAIW